jgi:hypothetical protein
MKQTTTLKKILDRYFSDQDGDVEFTIKEEVCDILNLFLDYKMDVMLNNLKEQFREIVSEYKLKELLMGQQEEAIQGADAEYYNLEEEVCNKFDEFIKLKINKLLPPIMQTGTSIDTEEERLKPLEGKYIDRLDINLIL